ncbi:MULTISPECIES: ComEC/Rec2 family competence protein [unclassified Spirosoma]|uniref:ComEC/Rec2 family competence protein n=1 Tax=unclassified Spirosoma TaxID=2621999 RepID=UPI00096863DE|nr:MULTISPECIES: ComEC/Rec2 family competence protein [unclassified Spirosoma]MBN8825629.1 ComEC family competence protein [Spirosoma sp.]OJW71669.1 MAG: competence protein ComEC [Spirosoma sp. 48-14]
MNGQPFVRYVAGLIAGIVLYVLWPDWYFLPVGALAVGLCLYVWRFFSHSDQPIKPIQTLPGVGILLMLIGLGWAITFQRTSSNRSSDISHLTDSLQAYVGVISAQPEERAKTYRVELEIQQGRWISHQATGEKKASLGSAGTWHALSGRVIVYLDKAGQHMPSYGEVWIVSGAPRPIDPPLNPGEFNYKRYLSYRNIGHQQYLRPFQRQVLSVDPPNPVTRLATQVNRWADSVLTQQIGTRPEFGVVNAMILGVRDDLDTEQYRAYSAAGAVHILSVSGLHVGILFQVLTFLLGFLAKRKGGKLLMAALQLTILWFYALVTGFSPPVLRSAGMFSMVIVANALGRQQQLPNTLGASAFFILCFDPYALFSAGFQLSYLAVAGIGAWQSSLYQSVTFWSTWANRLWELTAVALVAQLITFPLGVFYFHQFPTYFLLANPVVIVMSEILLPLAMLCLALSWLPYLNSVLGWLLQKVAWLLNGAVQLTSELPGAAWDGLWLSPAALGLTYGIIFCGAALLLTRNRDYLWATCVASIALAVVLIAEMSHQAHQEKLAVHFLPHHTAVSLTSGRQCTLLTDLDSTDTRSYDFYLKNTFGQWGILRTRTAYLQRSGTPGGTLVSVPGLHQSRDWALWVWHDKTILLANKFNGRSNWRLPAVVDYLIIRRNALREWSQLNKRVVARHIIFDDSNRTPLTDKLLAEARERGISCFSVRQMGAYVADLE